MFSLSILAQLTRLCMVQQMMQQRRIIYSGPNGIIMPNWYLFDATPFRNSDVNLRPLEGPHATAFAATAQVSILFAQWAKIDRSALSAL